MNYVYEMNKFIDGDKVRYSFKSLVELYEMNMQEIYENGHDTICEAKESSYTLDYEFFINTIAPRLKRQKRKLMESGNENIYMLVCMYV